MGLRAHIHAHTHLVSRVRERPEMKHYTSLHKRVSEYTHTHTVSSLSETFEVTHTHSLQFQRETIEVTRYISLHKRDALRLSPQLSTNVGVLTPLAQNQFEKYGEYIQKDQRPCTAHKKSVDSLLV